MIETIDGTEIDNYLQEMMCVLFTEFMNHIKSGKSGRDSATLVVKKMVTETGLKQEMATQLVNLMGAMYMGDLERIEIISKRIHQIQYNQILRPLSEDMENYLVKREEDMIDYLESSIEKGFKKP